MAATVGDLFDLEVSSRTTYRKFHAVVFIALYPKEKNMVICICLLVLGYMVKQMVDSILPDIWVEVKE